MLSRMARTLCLLSAIFVLGCKPVQQTSNAKADPGPCFGLFCGWNASTNNGIDFVLQAKAGWENWTESIDAPLKGVPLFVTHFEAPMILANKWFDDDLLVDYGIDPRNPVDFDLTEDNPAVIDPINSFINNYKRRNDGDIVFLRRDKNSDRFITLRNPDHIVKSFDGEFSSSVPLPSKAVIVGGNLTVCHATTVRDYVSQYFQQRESQPPLTLYFPTHAIYMLGAVFSPSDWMKLYSDFIEVYSAFRGFGLDPSIEFEFHVRGYDPFVVNDSNGRSGKKVIYKIY